MNKVFDLVRQLTATTGTGTITLGAAVTGFRTFATGTAVTGDICTYGIQDANGARALEWGVYNSTGPTLTRGGTYPSGTAVLSLSGSAEIISTPAAEDFEPVVNSAVAGSYAWTTYSDAGTAKWRLGKHTDNGWIGYDVPNARAWLFITPAGDMILGEGGSNNFLQGGWTLTEPVLNGASAKYLTASATSTGITTATQTNIASISLTNGSWEVQGVIYFDGDPSGVTYVVASISTTSATVSANGALGRTQISAASLPDPALYTGLKRIDVAGGPQTVYLVGYAEFTGTMNTIGHVDARRVW